VNISARGNARAPPARRAVISDCVSRILTRRGEFLVAKRQNDRMKWLFWEQGEDDFDQMKSGEDADDERK